MTKKHFEALAKAFADSRPHRRTPRQADYLPFCTAFGMWLKLRDQVADVCAQTNREEFIKATEQKGR